MKYCCREKLKTRMKTNQVSNAFSFFENEMNYPLSYAIATYRFVQVIEPLLGT